MNTYPTIRPLFGMYRLRAAYVRWKLGNAEQDIEHGKAQLKFYEREAERLRVELSLLNGL